MRIAVVKYVWTALSGMAGAFSKHQFQKQPFRISFTSKEWERYLGTDKNGKPKLKKGYGAILTKPFWSYSTACTDIGVLLRGIDTID